MTGKFIQKGPGQSMIDESEQERGKDVKKARNLSPNAGHSPHEVGMDQRVEDAKRERARKKNQGNAMP